MKLLIDVGNTYLKWSVASNDGLTESRRRFYFEYAPVQQFERLLIKESASCDSIIMVSVLGDEFNDKAHEIARKYDLFFTQVRSEEVLSGVTNAYDEPHKLGADRFVAMIGAYHLSNKQQGKEKACIIVDSGTATTIDAVDKQGKHLGGLILPGLDLCRRSLLQNTKQLSRWGKPENNIELTCHLFSTNTVDAIHSASILGLSGAVEQISLNMKKEIQLLDNQIQVDIYLCGGSAEIILPYLQFKFKLQKDLIMQGLKVVTGC